MTDRDSKAEIHYRGKTLQLEYAWVAPENRGPLIVFLHEGLGSSTMWRAFPEALCKAVGSRGLVYSRCGYGQSSALWPDRDWPVQFMHVEACEILPRFFASLGIDTEISPPVLFGHSDGASIAIIYACSFPGSLSAVIAAAPHILVEQLTVASIAETRRRFTDTDLHRRLSKYHRDVEHAFWGWAGVWLNPEFLTWNIEALLPHLSCPALLVQGYDDEYGTMRQIDGIAAAAPHVDVLKLARCGHSPHLDQPNALIASVAEFLGRNGLTESGVRQINWLQ